MSRNIYVTTKDISNKSTQYAADCKLQPAKFAFYTVPFTLYTFHSTLYTAHFSLHTLHCTLNIL